MFLNEQISFFLDHFTLKTKCNISASLHISFNEEDFPLPQHSDMVKWLLNLLS
jgi:hypothetical protein